MVFGTNTAFVVSKNLLDLRYDPYMSFNFLVEIDGLLVGGFRRVTGLEIQVEVETYREGGRNDWAHKFPGQVTQSDLTLEHGLTDVDALWDWHQDVISGKIKKKNGTVYLLDRRRLPAMWWDFRRAYPIQWTGPQLDASSNEVAVESVVLAHEGIVKPTASQLMSKARMAGAAAGGLT